MTRSRQVDTANARLGRLCDPVGGDEDARVRLDIPPSFCSVVGAAMLSGGLIGLLAERLGIVTACALLSAASLLAAPPGIPRYPGGMRARQTRSW